MHCKRRQLSPKMSPKTSPGHSYRHSLPAPDPNSGAVFRVSLLSPSGISATRNAQVVSSNLTISSSKIKASGVLTPEAFLAFVAQNINTRGRH